MCLHSALLTTVGQQSCGACFKKFRPFFSFRPSIILNDGSSRRLSIVPIAPISANILTHTSFPPHLTLVACQGSVYCIIRMSNVSLFAPRKNTYLPLALVACQDSVYCIIRMSNVSLFVPRKRHVPAPFLWCFCAFLETFQLYIKRRTGFM